MSNVNYTGSSAQRFMDFSSKLQSVSEASTDLFNTIEIFIPASLAAANIKDYAGEGLTEDKPVVKTVTADNYKDVMIGDLFNQWKHFFSDGTNVDGTIYLVVYYDTTFKVLTDPTQIANAGLKGKIANKAISTAFDKLYNLAYFKTLFFTDYKGKPGVGSEPYTKVNAMFDAQLCLANLCENEPKLSMFLAYYQIDLTQVTYSVGEGGQSNISDKNLCSILSTSMVDEEKNAVTFAESTPENRAKYFWGFLKLIGGKRTAISINNGVYFDPIRLNVWMGRKNASGTYIGNKLAKIKLVDPLIKPTGTPNEVEEDVNNNLDYRLAEIVDPKHVAYLLSISDASQNHSQVIDDKTVSGFPINADMMAKYIDYTCSQQLAEFCANLRTLDNPVLVNQQTYSYIQNLVSNTIQTISKTGRLTNISLSFPSYTEAKKGNTFVGNAAWSAYYIDDLAGVKISGSVSF